MVVTTTVMSFGQTCDCVDYLYVNDPALDITHKFTINPDGTIGPEIFSSGTTPWLAPNVITNAHGVVSDLAGNLYISQIDTDPTTLYQVGCDGTIKSTDFIPNWDRTLNMVTIGSTIYSIGRDPAGGDYMIYSHDLCSSADIASIPTPAAANGSTSSWGLTLGLDGELYFTQTFGATNTNDHCVFHVTPDLTTITQVFCLPNIDNHHTFGVAQDECGNFYVVVTETAPGSTTVYKVDSNGNVISSITDNALDDVGFGGAWGIVYNEPTGKLYIGTRGDDCVAVLDAGGCNGNLTYEMNSGVPHVPGAYSKAVNIQRECCPVQSNVVIDTFVCDMPLGGMVEINTLIECAEGIMCGAEWEEVGDSPSLVLDNCLQSVTSVALQGCGTYMLQTPPNGSCAPSTTTLNVGFLQLEAGSLGADMTVCNGENPPSLPITVNASSSSSTLSYQWQSSTVSCSAGWSDVAGATSQNYDPPAISTTTHYRLVVDAVGCNGLGGCEKMTNCLTIEVQPTPTANAAPVDVTCNGEDDGSATVTVTGGTPGYTYTWNDPAAQTSATATGLTPGTYNVTVSDANNCMDVSTVVITEPAPVPCAEISISRN